MIVSILLAALVLLALYVASHRLSGVHTGVAVLGAVCGFTLVIFPNVSSVVATALGVGRGSDLLMYFSIVGGLFIAAHLYFRSKQQERQIIDLTRALALGTTATHLDGTAVSRGQ